MECADNSIIIINKFYAYLKILHRNKYSTQKAEKLNEKKNM